MSETTAYFLASILPNGKRLPDIKIYVKSMLHAKQSATLVFKGADPNLTLVISTEEDYSGEVKLKWTKKNVPGKRWEPATTPKR